LFNAFITLFVVLNPLGTAPFFVGLTRSRVELYKRVAAIKGTSPAILFFFALVGRGLLNALEVKFSAFRIAGGILLFLLDLDTIFARPSRVRRTTMR